MLWAQSEDDRWFDERDVRGWALRHPAWRRGGKFFAVYDGGFGLSGRRCNSDVLCESVWSLFAMKSVAEGISLGRRQRSWCTSYHVLVSWFPVWTTCVRPTDPWDEDRYLGEIILLYIPSRASSASPIRELSKAILGVNGATFAKEKIRWSWKPKKWENFGENACM